MVDDEGGEGDDDDDDVEEGDDGEPVDNAYKLEDIDDLWLITNTK